MIFNLKKKSILNICLMFAFLLTFRELQYFPGMSIAKEIWLLGVTVITAIVCLQYLSRTKWNVDTFEIYICSIIIIIPISTAMNAYHEFGQPLAYGILANRNIIFATFALLLMKAVKGGFVRIRDIESAFISLAWITLIAFTSMVAFLDPLRFLHVGNGFVGLEEGRASFKFISYFIAFGFFYYSLRGFQERKVKYYIPALLFFTFLLLAVGGRVQILSVIASFLILVWRRGSISRFVLNLPKVVLAGSLFMAMLLTFYASPMQRFSEKMVDAVQVVMTGEEGNDASANSRIKQISLIIPFIENNPILGNGLVSQQWRGGFEGILGDRFYSSDVGLAGVVFIYGIFGAFFFLIQFVFAFKYSRKLSQAKLKTPFTIAVQAFLVYFLLFSLTTGKFAHYFGVSVVMVAILKSHLDERNRHVRI